MVSLLRTASEVGKRELEATLAERPGGVESCPIVMRREREENGKTTPSWDSSMVQPWVHYTVVTSAQVSLPLANIINILTSYSARILWTSSPPFSSFQTTSCCLDRPGMRKLMINTMDSCKSATCNHRHLLNPAVPIPGRTGLGKLKRPGNSTRAPAESGKDRHVQPTAHALPAHTSFPSCAAAVGCSAFR